jgi:hypothetical protein
MRPTRLSLSEDGSRLSWSYGGALKGERGSKLVVRRDMLERFIALAGLRADEPVARRRVLSLARSFGPLHLHGKPWADGYDDVAGWLREARIYRAILSISQDFRSGLRRGSDQWGPIARSLGYPMPTDATDAATLLSASLHAFVVPNVRLYTSVSASLRLANRISVSLGGGGLRGALSAEMLLEVQGRERGMVECSSCRGWFSPTRATGGRRAFCSAPTCGRAAAVRFSMRDMRARRKAATPRRTAPGKRPAKGPPRKP